MAIGISKANAGIINGEAAQIPPWPICDIKLCAITNKLKHALTIIVIIDI